MERLEERVLKKKRKRVTNPKFESSEVPTEVQTV